MDRMQEHGLEKEYAPLSYKRSECMMQWLSYIFGKETEIIPLDIVDVLRAEFEKSSITSAEITPALVRIYIKKLGLFRNYENASKITRMLGGSMPPDITPDVAERVKYMLDKVQSSFQRNKPENRNSFMSWSYVLHQIFRLLGRDDILPLLPLPRSRQKLSIYDKIWKELCADSELNWEFIPSCN